MQKESSYLSSSARSYSPSDPLLPKSFGNSVNPTNEEIYTIYTRRWFMVILFSGVCFVNNLVWLSFASVEVTAQKYYGIGSFQVDIHVMVFQVIATVLVLLGSWVVDVKGLRFAVNIAAISNFVGCWIRCVGYFFSPKIAFWIEIAGAGVVALAQPVLLVGATKIAANWFPGNERTTATSIASLSNLVGMAASYALSFGLVKQGDDFNLLYVVHAGIASISSILCLIFFRSKPPTAPSSSADSKTEATISVKDFKTILSNPSFIVLFFSFGIGFGIFTAIFGILDQVVSPQGYDQTEAGWFGISIIGGGLVGAAILGGIVDKWKRYKEILILAFTGSILAVGYMYIELFTTWIPHKEYIVFSSMVILGFFAISILPVGLDAAVEVTFPAPEATSTGLLVLSGNIFSIIFLVVMNVLEGKSNGTMVNSMRFCLGAIVLSWIAIFFFRGPYKRLDYEKKANITINHGSVEKQ